MATTSEVFCDICTAQDKANSAIKWCPECEDALCDDCTKHHSNSKSTRNHATIAIADYKKLPDFVSNIKQTCEDHQEKFQLFCTLHDSACCGKCVISNHSTCKGILPVDDILENAKTSSNLQHVEEILVDIRKNIQNVIKDRTQNLKNVQSQIKKAKDAVRETREKLNKHLDILEKDLITEIEQKETEIQQSTQTVLKDLEDKDLKAKEYQENLKTIKEHGTNLQTFFGTREVLKCTEKEEKCINNYFEDGSLNNIDFQFQLNDSISKCLAAEKFGSLSITTTQTDVKLVHTKTKAAQFGTLLSRTKQIDDIKVVLNKTFRVQSGKSGLTITGCDVTANGKLVFADCDNNKRLVIHSMEGTFISEFNNDPQYAFDVSVIGDQKVAVTNGDYRRFRIVDIATNKIINDIITKSRCEGIVYMDRKVVSAIYQYGLVAYCLEDGSSTTIRRDDLAYQSYITYFMDKIYYTNTSGSLITCLSSKGELLWTVTDNTLIKQPRSIATDRHGNIFVSSTGNNSIVVISSDGKCIRKIIDEKDRIDNAWALCCDKIRNKLVVANWSGDVFVFDII